MLTSVYLEKPQSWVVDDGVTKRSLDWNAEELTGEVRIEFIETGFSFSTEFTARKDYPIDVEVWREVWVEDVYHVVTGEYWLPSLVGKTVCDVGANIGAFSALMLALGAHVVALEPEPENAQLLRKNLNESPYADNATVYEVALGRLGASTLKMLDTGGGAQVGVAYDDSLPSIEMLSVRDLLEREPILENGCALLKMDCEGSEWGIFANMLGVHYGGFWESHIANIASGRPTWLPERITAEIHAHEGYDGESEPVVNPVELRTAYGRLVGAVAMYYNLHLIGAGAGMMYGSRHR